MTPSLDREEEADTMPNNDLVTTARWAGGHRASEGGQFRFWSNLKVPFCVHLWHILVIRDISSHI